MLISSSLGCFLRSQWIKHVDEQGRPYYYSADGSRSEWELPKVRSSTERQLVLASCPPPLPSKGTRLIALHHLLCSLIARPVNVSG